jgi:hypothetical protein
MNFLDWYATLKRGDKVLLTNFPRGGTKSEGTVVAVDPHGLAVNADHRQLVFNAEGRGMFWFPGVTVGPVPTDLRAEFDAEKAEAEAKREVLRQVEWFIDATCDCEDGSPSLVADDLNSAQLREVLRFIREVVEQEEKYRASVSDPRQAALLPGGEVRP